MTRAIHSGGSTHARYAHRSRARDLDVVCPRCEARAVATQPSAAGSGVVVSDVHPAWRESDWRVTCSRCPHRLEGLGFDALPPLFWQFDGIWGWNRDHLVFVARLLDGEDVASDPYAWFAAYVPGEWKRDGKRVARAIWDRIGAPRW